FLEWPNGLPKGYDLNDVLINDGIEGLRTLLYWEDLSEPTDKKQKSRSTTQPVPEEEFVWPEIKPLETADQLPEPPLELLDHCGDWQRKFVESLAESRQVPAEAVLLAFFTAVSAAAMRIVEVPYQRYEHYESKD